MLQSTDRDLDSGSDDSDDSDEGWDGLQWAGYDSDESTGDLDCELDDVSPHLL